MTISGASLIGGVEVPGGDGVFRAVDPSTGEAQEPPFGGATMADLDRACALAAAAFPTFREADEARARLLDGIADGIEVLGQALIERAMLETGLPEARLVGERARTTGQLRMFAGIVRAGGWRETRVDPALPGRQPLPRPDLRRRNVALGPVAVFGASNFPLAFSVAGGDTVAALAAGCPVVVKAHPSHPGTSELVGRAVQAAVRGVGVDPGVFALLHDSGVAVAQALVADGRIKAVGFTGSRRAGLALVAIAQARPEPIPVYAEMSSVNPVLVLASALAARGPAIARALVAAMAMGAGQFCTSPGLVLAVDGPDLDAFVAEAAAAVREASAAIMLSPGIHRVFHEALDRLQRRGAHLVARGPDGPACRSALALMETSAAALLADPALADEAFGAACMVVRCRDLNEIERTLASLEGQLTVALHLDDGDHDAARRLLPLCELKAGRVIFNGFGTGVEVADAMVHSGPWPATSDGGRSSSVGPLAIERFLRPVCYQDAPAALLPPSLR